MNFVSTMQSKCLPKCFHSSVFFQLDMGKKIQVFFKWTARLQQLLLGSCVCKAFQLCINSLSSREKIAEFANRVDLDEVAHEEPPHLDLHCLSSNL